MPIPRPIVSGPATGEHRLNQILTGAFQSRTRPPPCPLIKQTRCGRIFFAKLKDFKNKPKSFHKNTLNLKRNTHAHLLPSWHQLCHKRGVRKRTNAKPALANDLQASVKPGFAFARSRPPQRRSLRPDERAFWRMPAFFTLHCTKPQWRGSPRLGLLHPDALGREAGFGFDGRRAR